MKLTKAEPPIERVKSIVHETLEEFLRTGERSMRVDPEAKDGNYNWVKRFASTAGVNKMPIKVVRAGGNIYLVRLEERKT